MPDTRANINPSCGDDYALMCEARKKFTEAFITWVVAAWPSAGDVAEEIDGTASVLRQQARGLS